MSFHFILKNFLWYFRKCRSDSNKFSHPFLIWKYLDFTLSFEGCFNWMLNSVFFYFFFHQKCHNIELWPPLFLMRKPLTIMCTVTGLFVFILFGVHWDSWIRKFIVFQQIWENFCHFLFKFFFMPHSFFSVSPVPTKLNHLMLLHMPLKLIWIILIFFSLSFRWEISINLVSTILSSAVSTLLLSSDFFFMSGIVLFSYKIFGSFL